MQKNTRCFTLTDWKIFSCQTYKHHFLLWHSLCHHASFCPTSLCLSQVNLIHEKQREIEMDVGDVQVWETDCKSDKFLLFLKTFITPCYPPLPRNWGCSQSCKIASLRWNEISMPAHLARELLAKIPLDRTEQDSPWLPCLQQGFPPLWINARDGSFNTYLWTTKM